MAEEISETSMATDSAEEGEIRDSDEERVAPARPPASRPRPHRSRPAAHTAPSKDRPDRRRRIPARREEPRRRSRSRHRTAKRNHHVQAEEEEDDDVETMIAKTRRRLGTTAPAKKPESDKKQPEPEKKPPEPPKPPEEPELLKKPEQDDEIEVLDVPPKLVELVELVDDEKDENCNDEREQELLQLRLMALKSSIEAKWGPRKKRNADDQPYSPTGPIEPLEGVDCLDSPVPSPLSDSGSEEEEEDEDFLRRQLLQQIKANEDKENQNSSTPPVAEPQVPVEVQENGATDNTSSTSSGRFIIRIGPDSSDSESESEPETSKTISSTDIDHLLKKLRHDAEKPKNGSKEEVLKESSSAKSVHDKNSIVSKHKSSPLPKSNPLSHLPKSRQAEYLRLKALLKKKEEVRRQRLLRAKTAKAQTPKQTEPEPLEPSEPKLPSLSALSQSLPLLSHEQRAARLAALEADLESQRERSKSQEARVEDLSGRLAVNKKQQEEATATREAALAQKLEQEARVALLRQQLAEAESLVAAATKSVSQADSSLEQLSLEVPALEVALGAAREESARLRAGCKLILEACAQARGDKDAEALQEQLEVLGVLANAPLQYSSPLDHIRSGQRASVDPNQQLCPLFLTAGGCSLGRACLFQHPASNQNVNVST